MFTALFVLALFVVAMLVVGALVAVASILGFVISLPFRIIGWTLKLVGLALVLPFLILGGVLAGGSVLLALAFGLLLPLAPVLAIAWLVWWLVTRDNKRSHASVAS